MLHFLNTSVLFLALCAIGTSSLVIVAFVGAYIQVPHEHEVALVFIIPVGFFIVSLVQSMNSIITREWRAARVGIKILTPHRARELRLSSR
jgi:hypothetical protein